MELFEVKKQDDITEFSLETRHTFIPELVLHELAGVFQNNQAEFGLGDLTVGKKFSAERKTASLVRCRTSDELRTLPALTSLTDYETDEKLARETVVLVCEYMLFKDLGFRFGPKVFLTYVNELQAARQEENWENSTCMSESGGVLATLDVDQGYITFV